MDENLVPENGRDFQGPRVATVRTSHARGAHGREAAGVRGRACPFLQEEQSRIGKNVVWARFSDYL
eukprot:1771418-Pyramimonas_sp.AAC.1